MRESKYWLFGLFGALAFNLSSLPFLSFAGTMDLASRSGDCIRQGLTTEGSAKCTLETQVDGRKVRFEVTATVEEVAAKKHLDLNTGKWVQPAPGETVNHIKIDFDSAVLEASADCHCEEMSIAKPASLKYALADSAEIAKKLKEDTQDDTVKAIQAAKEKAAADAEINKAKLAKAHREELCLEKDGERLKAGSEDQMGCFTDHLSGMEDSEKAAKYYQKNIQPKLEKLLSEDCTSDLMGARDGKCEQDHQLAKSTLSQLNGLDVSSTNDYLSRSLAQFDKFVMYSDRIARDTALIKSAVSSTAMKQQALQDLTNTKQSFNDYFSKQADSTLKLPTPDGFTSSTFNTGLYGEIAGTQAGGQTVTNGYLADLNTALVQDHLTMINAGRNGTAVTPQTPVTAQPISFGQPAATPTATAPSTGGMPQFGSAVSIIKRK